MSEKKRRPRGQVVPLDDGARRACRTWGVRVPLKERGPNGRHLTHYETLYDTTELKAEKRRDALLAQIEAGQFFRPAPMCVSKLIDEWLGQKERQGLRRATLYTYRDAANSYIKPHVGYLDLSELTPRKVRDLLNALQDRDLADSTIKFSRKLLNLVVKDAIAWGYLRENPVIGIAAPKGATGRVGHSLTPTEARALLDTAVLDPEDLVFAFALLTGLRPEEYLGLPRRHLELQTTDGKERGVVRVRQVAVKVRGGGWEFPPPKTAKGRRDVPFPLWLYHELMKFEAIVDTRRRVTGEGWTDYGLVFPSRTGAPQYPEHLYRGRFSSLLARAGLPAHFTLYSLRYTFATLQFMAGERDRVISDLMGHTRTDFTKDVYTKVLPQMREQASDSLERLLSEAPRTAFAQSVTEQVM